MKMKSFAVLATSGLMAALFAYAMPAIAEDATSSGQSMQAQPSDNNAQNPSSNAPQGSGSSSQSDTNIGSPNSPSNPSSTDENAPEKDSATGDDDY